MDLVELARIRALGQQAPLYDSQGNPISYEGPNTPIDQQEQNVLFPNGLPDAAHRGGLAQLAFLSRQQGQGGSSRPQQPDPAMERKQPQTSVPDYEFKPQTHFTGAPEAFASADRAGRQSEAIRGLTHAVGKLIRTAAMAYAGGGMAGGAGAGGAGAGGGTAGAAGGMGEAGAIGGAAPAAGSAAGSSSAADGAGFFSGGSGGTMGQIQQYGQLAKLAQGGGGGGGGGQGGGSEPGFESSFDTALGWSAKRKAALAALGLGPYDAGLVTMAGQYQNPYGG